MNITLMLIESQSLIPEMILYFLYLQVLGIMFKMNKLFFMDINVAKKRHPKTRTVLWVGILKI